MKTQVTKNKVLNYFGKNRVLCFGYCKIQGMEHFLLVVAKSHHFTTGVYGWNADIYAIEGGGKFFAICTGHRHFGTYDEKLSEIAEKYEKKYKAAEWNEKESVTLEFLDAIEAYLEEKEISK